MAKYKRSFWVESHRRRSRKVVSNVGKISRKCKRKKIT